MKMTLLRLLALGFSLSLTACVTQGGWMGADAEQAYDRALDHRRMVAARNNDDYFEYHRGGKVYVLAEADDVRDFFRNRPARFPLTLAGAGARGEDLVFAVAKPENFKNVGFGAVEMYYGRRHGRARDFYAEVYRKGIYYVFDDWAALDTYRFRGLFKAAATVRSADGRTVQFASGNPALRERFMRLRE